MQIWPFFARVGAVEKLSWLTEVLQSRTTEDAISLRRPLQSFGYNYTMTDRQLARADFLYRSDPLADWLVPVWPDRSFVSGILAADTTIAVEPAADYRVGDKALIASSDEIYTEVEISALGAGSIDLVAPVGADYTSAVVVPLRAANCPGGISITRRHFGLTDIAMEFHVATGAEFPETPFSQYQGIDVMSDPAVIKTGLAGGVVYPVAVLDNGFSRPATEPVRDVMRGRHSAFFIDDTPAAIARRKKWLYAINGRQGRFWLPTWADDMDLAAPITAASNSITVTPVLPLPADYIGRHIAIYDPATGAGYYREITSAIQSGQNHRLYMTPLGVDLAAARLSFLVRVRSDNDNVEIRHVDGTRAETALQMIEV